MSIENHVFEDGEVTLSEANRSVIRLNCDLAYGENCQYIDLGRDDAIAIARHFEITEFEISDE